ncbi:DUF3048 domain-containing protein [Kutzneria kofuensis]|uniref:DUF3048 family protein n=1 Tax=Kutzneria kofuensis TaxID=103725 RepID=A0A7W9NLZ1_9PSEU|nr:DUF3048 domain-containing protein [Kutzneria kofuensis]MBB5897264.1 hypothetical protein [Kutzneria kofuensis]
MARIWLVPAAAVLLLVSSCSGRSAAPEPTTTTAVPAGSALVVKIDNVAAARPQTGLTMADVVYVEPVEGGLTRIAAVYLGKLPPVIGPVRSARETDIDLLGQYGRPTLACSGSAPQLAPLLRNAGMETGCQSAVPTAYFRDSSRQSPHDLFVHPDKLPKGAGTVTPEQTGPAPAGGTPVTKQHEQVASVGFDFEWSDQKWLISMDGSPLTTTDGGRVGAATVVVEKVTTRAGTVPGDAAGNPSPVGVTVGSGPATVFRDGKSFQATWSRPSRTDATIFADAAGNAVPVADGPLWILLAPVS